LNSTVHRLRRDRKANELVSDALGESDREVIVTAAARAIADLLDTLHVDHNNDHNTRDTPARVARMFVNEIMRGRFSEPPALTDFDNVHGFDQLIVIGPIDVRSTCAHHLMPIYGEAFIGVLPGSDGRIIGLSKYDRIVDHFAGRLQIQEELVQQIGRYIMDQTQPRGVAVRIDAVHMCKTHRGVRASHRSRMVTNTFLGTIADDPQMKSQFLDECRALAQAPLGRMP